MGIAHLFLPKKSNNYRSKLIHNHILFIFVIFFLWASLASFEVKKNFPQVLGISTNMTYEQLLVVTNEHRKANNLLPLSLNSQLNNAAEQKAKDMFLNNYWAHVSPNGTTPWVFIKSSGYAYVYAGENLARGFTTANDVVTAWMNSPEHRENELSPNYQDVGFAIKTGKLLGEDTVLVVEEFGGKNIASTPSNSTTQTTSLPSSSVAALSSGPLIDIRTLSSSIYVGAMVMFIIVLGLDMLVVEKRKIVRISGHNMDHILFFLTFILAGFLIIKGVVI